MEITLPESLEPNVRRRVEEGGYASIDEYVRTLIMADLLSPETKALIQVGLDSGPGVVANDAFWEGLRNRREQRRSAKVTEG